MIHQVRVRDLNSLANQLARGSYLKEKLQATVREAVEAGIQSIDFDDEKADNKGLIKLVADAVSNERSANESRSVIRRETEDVENKEKEKTGRFGKSRKR